MAKPRSTMAQAPRREVFMSILAYSSEIHVPPDHTGFIPGSPPPILGQMRFSGTVSPLSAVTAGWVVLRSFRWTGLRELEASMLLAPRVLRCASVFRLVEGLLPLGLIRLQSR